MALSGDSAGLDWLLLVSEMVFEPLPMLVALKMWICGSQSCGGHIRGLLWT